MSKTTELVFSWLPLLVLLVAWFYFSRKFGIQGRGRSGKTMIELYEQQVEETRQMNANLERIAAALEKREAGAAPR